MRYEKVALVNPPLDSETRKCVDADYWQPMNLLTLASHLGESGYPGQVQIFDQSVISPEGMTGQLLQYKPDLVGISPHMDSYQEGVRIAEMMKAHGADVAMGGSYATTLGMNIMKNREAIDYVVRHDGERALKALVSGDPLDDIKNLIFKDVGEIVSNPLEFNPNATLSEIDYSLVNLQAYFDNYAGALNQGEFERPITILTQRGCIWKDKTGGCVFCSRIEPFLRHDDVDEVWKRVRKLKEEYSVDSIIDVGDDFLGDPKWFRAFHAARPPDLEDIGIRFIYSRANNITPQRADMLKDLNTFEVFLGLESGDPQVLRNVAKGSTPAQQLKAIKRLADRGINVIAAFVLGLPGESRESLARTLAHAEEVLKHPNINELVVSIMIPLPGSQAHDVLIKSDPRLAAQYSHSDLVDVGQLQRDWVRGFCDTDFETVKEYLQRMSNLSNKVVTELVEGDC